MIDNQQEIKDFIRSIESEHNIKVILAIESGSRAWGFPSQDSDYDIRLVYHHPQSWYVSAFKKRNIIENIFDGDLDAAGWDITKCLQLLYKGNAPLYEWLNSPIVYQKNTEKLDIIKHLSREAFNPKVIFYHYISLAKKKLLEDKARTSAKSFLYALRALLCAQWVRDDLSAPPVEFERLANRYIEKGNVRDSVNTFIDIKSTRSEADNDRVCDELWGFSNDLFLALEKEKLTSVGLKTISAYDQVLLEILNID